MATKKVAMSCISRRFVVNVSVELEPCQKRQKGKKASSLFKPASTRGFRTVKLILEATIFKKVVV